MNIDQFIERIESLTSTVQSNQPNNMWQFGIERLVESLRRELRGTNLADNLQYQIDGSLVSILAPDYLLYQNYGVAGALGNKKGARPDEFSDNYTHKYGMKKPPADVFERYGEDLKFAIQQSVYQFGIAPKGWFTREELETQYIQLVQSFIEDNNI